MRRRHKRRLKLKLFKVYSGKKYIVFTILGEEHFFYKFWERWFNKKNDKIN